MSNEFEREVVARIIENSNDKTLLKAGNEFLFASINSKYSYNFAWMGRPIIQYPQDIVAMQELVWSIKPDLIIETGIAHGGSLILSASLLAMLDYTDAVESGVMLDPKSAVWEYLKKHLEYQIDQNIENKLLITVAPHGYLKRVK